MSHQTQAALPIKDSANDGVLHMAIEMGEKNWKLLFSDGEFKRNGQLKVYQQGVDGNDYVALGEAVEKAIERFKLGAGATMVSCYEAGQDGFWPHRQLEALVKRQRRALEAKQKETIEEATSENEVMQKTVVLALLRGIGQGSAWQPVMEFFGWRQFKNRRQVAGCAGLDPTPYDSGESRREQGISKAGNKRVRWLMVELAWSWLRFQPASVLSQWFQKRFGGGGKRQRRIGIVALARRLLVALWRYVDIGMVPEGAELKSAV